MPRKLLVPGSWVGLSRSGSVLALAIALALACLPGCGDDIAPPPPPAGAPQNFAAGVMGANVHLTWSLPAGTPSAKVLRRLDVEPTGPSDSAAVVVHTGAATQADDRLAGLLPTTTLTPRTYRYAAFGCNVAGECETTGSRAQAAPTVVQCLGAGGYTIYWRHALANICGDRTDLGTAATTSVPNWWRSCATNCDSATARQLGQAGIDSARTMGMEMSARQIPFGRVVSSEFCRCTQTAEYMGFAPATIELDQGITFFVYDEMGRCGASMLRLAEPPAAGTNTAIIGHAGFSTPCPVLSTLNMGDAAIFKPDGTGGATFIERVLVGGWDSLP